MGYIRAVACVVLAAGGVSWATSPEARNAWLMKNYRFTGPPPPRMVSAANPAVAELQQVQSTLGSMIRRANLDGDYVTALDATAQSAFNAMQIGAMTAFPPATGGIVPEAGFVAPPPAPPCKQLTTWSDGLMMHYITPQGTHVQVRQGK